jgi:hypothetical protein
VRGPIPPQHTIHWYSAEEIVAIGFQRSFVVMMNEAHNGLQRCIRTRQIGRQILPIAHHAGVRHLAMEALNQAFAEQGNRARRVPALATGYLAQPEMRDLIPYEADTNQWIKDQHGIDLTQADPDEIQHPWQEWQSEFISLAFTNWREEQQALNILRALQSLPEHTPLLIWCGNSHHAKTPRDGWIPMGYRFQQHSQIDPFVIDQTISVKFDPNNQFHNQFFEKEWILPFAKDLANYGGAAGFLTENVPEPFVCLRVEDLGVDAVLLSTQNELE